MPTNIVIPEVGESVSSGVIAAWTKAEGEWVERDETVLELETDKITMEVPAPASGVVSHAAGEGDEVEVGAVVGAIDESAERPGGAPAADEQKARAEGQPARETPAATTTAQAPSSNTQQAQPAAPTSNGSANSPARPADDSVSATPLARKLAAQYSISLASVTGTGASGRIREQDVLALVHSGSHAAAAPSQAASATREPQTQQQAHSRGTTTERMSPMRQRIAARLVEAQQTAAMLTTFNEVDMTGVMQLRKKHKEAFAERHDVGLGFMSFFVRAACAALKSFPDVNAYITADDKGSPAVQRHDYCDVAIAVSSPKGLVVPVLRSAETMSFADVERTIKDFGKRAKDGKLDLAEMQGGTFTITNGGVFGSLMSTPILNPPQSAILGMHGIKNRPVEHPEKPGEIALRPMMYLALSYDHRIVDGAGAVQFLVAIKNAIEDPARLMLDL